MQGIHTVVKGRLHTQHEPHDPWSRTSLIVGQSGHWVRASKESGREVGSIVWVRTGSGILLGFFTTPHIRLTCSTEIPSKFKFTPACDQHHHKNIQPFVNFIYTAVYTYVNNKIFLFVCPWVCLRSDYRIYFKLNLDKIMSCVGTCLRRCKLVKCCSKLWVTFRNIMQHV